MTCQLKLWNKQKLLAEPLSKLFSDSKQVNKITYNIAEIISIHKTGGKINNEKKKKILNCLKA